MEFSNLRLLLILAFTATLTLTIPVKNSTSNPKQLIMLIEIYRHGASTPKFGNIFNQEYIKTLGNDEITPTGLEQQLNLGRTIRDNYSHFF